MNHYDPHMYDFKIHIIYVCVQLFSGVQLFSTLLTVAHQAPLSMGLSRQEYWSGLPCPPPGDLPQPGIEPVSPGFFSVYFAVHKSHGDLQLEKHHPS